jgi:hypothetical protein
LSRIRNKNSSVLDRVHEGFLAAVRAWIGADRYEGLVEIG